MQNTSIRCSSEREATHLYSKFLKDKKAIYQPTELEYPVSANPQYKECMFSPFKAEVCECGVRLIMGTTLCTEFH